MDFNQMLEDVFTELGTSEKNKIILPVPELDKGTTRVIWKNIKDFLKLTKTPREHVFNFVKYKLKDEIGWVLIENEKKRQIECLIIHNKKIKVKDIEDIMKEYISQFVICKICNKSNTTMYKDKTIREMKVKCNECNSSYTIA